MGTLGGHGSEVCDCDECAAVYPEVAGAYYSRGTRRTAATTATSLMSTDEMYERPGFLWRVRHALSDFIQVYDNGQVRVGQVRIYGRYDGRPIFQLRQRFCISRLPSKVGVDVDLATLRVRTLAKFGDGAPVLGMEGRPAPEVIYTSARMWGDPGLELRVHLGFNIPYRYPTIWFRMKSKDDLRPRVDVSHSRDDWRRPMDARATQSGFDYCWRLGVSETSMLKIVTGVDLARPDDDGHLALRWSLRNIRIKQYLTGNPLSEWLYSSRRVQAPQGTDMRHMRMSPRRAPGRIQLRL